ncbi:unnamed protein product [Lymnaea stagnalis]|uniref:Uncharacterized protein n=1 Tax=Lymnaea stagnalis TaxID=6523 RepID=A0AAV2IAE1_LYMST
MTAQLGWRLLPLYDFDRRTGKWWYKENTVIQPLKSLSDMTFTKGSFKMNISKDLKVECSKDTITNSKSPTWLLDGSIPGLYYEEILERARYLFEEANERGRFESRDQTRDYDEVAHKLRWFMLPSEAVDVIYGRKVTCVAPEHLPFLPVTLAEKLKAQSNNRYK